MTAALILLMRYYARAFPPAGGTTGAMSHFVQLVRARARLLLLAAAIQIRSDDARARRPVRPAGDARAHLSPRLLHLKPYENGGLFSLYLDFFKGLSSYGRVAGSCSPARSSS